MQLSVYVGFVEQLLFTSFIIKSFEYISDNLDQKNAITFQKKERVF